MLQLLLLTPGWEMHLLRWHSAKLLPFTGSQSIRNSLRVGKELLAGAEWAGAGEGSGAALDVYFLPIDHCLVHRPSPKEIAR